MVMAPWASREARACSCFEHPPCAAFWQADAVFVGTVVDAGPERLGGSLSWIVHKISVGRSLRGSAEKLVTLVPGYRPTPAEIKASESYPGAQTASSTCDYPFEIGHEYVIYARRTADGRWTTSKCSGTKPVEEAAADLDYVSSLPLSAPTGRVYGNIDRTIRNPDDGKPMVVPAASVPVIFSNPIAGVTVATDSGGKLDVQLPPGNYTATPVVPQSIQVFGAPFQITVPSRGCA